MAPTTTKETKMSKHTYSATLPDGTVATRTTHRTYTHVLAVKLAGSDGWGDYSWCGRPDLAQKQLNTLRTRIARNGSKDQVQLVEVELSKGAKRTTGTAPAAPAEEAVWDDALLAASVTTNSQLEADAARLVQPVQLVRPEDSDNHAAWSEQLLRDQLLALKPAYKAYVQAQEAKREPSKYSVVALQATMESLRSQYRAYRKAADQLRELKKGAAAPAAPTGDITTAAGRRANSEARQAARYTVRDVRTGQARELLGKVAAPYQIIDGTTNLPVDEFASKAAATGTARDLNRAAAAKAKPAKAKRQPAGGDGPQALKDLLRLA